MMKFWRRNKLRRRYIRPLEIIWTVGKVFYELNFHVMFLAIYLVFYIWMLHRYFPNELHVLKYDAVELDDRLTFVGSQFPFLQEVCGGCAQGIFMWLRCVWVLI